MNEPVDLPLAHIVNHVFLPPRIPQQNDADPANDSGLVKSVIYTCEQFATKVDDGEKPVIDSILKMLRVFEQTQSLVSFTSAQVVKAFGDMVNGDVVLLYLKAQNAAVIVRRTPNRAVFEAFEVMPPNEVVFEGSGKIVRSFPGPAVSISANEFASTHFREEIANFLSRMDSDRLEVSTTTKAGVELPTNKDSPDPRFIITLLTGMLRGVGQEQTTIRISKRIADDAFYTKDKPWRRSPMWLCIRVALQTTLARHDPSHSLYKSLIAFFCANILDRAREAGFDGDELYCMRAKMCRKAGKLQDKCPQFLQDEVKEVANDVQTLLDSQWDAIQKLQSASSNWAPGQLDLEADSRLSLQNSNAHLQHALHRDGNVQQTPPFEPSHPRRLSTYTDFRHFTEATLQAAFHGEDVYTALSDFERVVRINLDGWVRNNRDDTRASQILFRCLREYLNIAKGVYAKNPENWSLMLLCAFELWVGIDKIATHQCRLLAEYPPTFPISLLEPLLLRKSTDLDRCLKIHNHVQQRHSEGGKRSVFSDEMGASSLAVRYYDASPRHQQLKADIDSYAEEEKAKKIEEMDQLRAQYDLMMEEARCMQHQHFWAERRGRQYEDKSRCPRCKKEAEARALSISVYEWPLPEDDNKTKQVIFEVQCPIELASWRSATSLLLHDICTPADDQQRRARSSVQLPSYQALTQFSKSPAGSLNRVTLASEVQSFRHSVSVAFANNENVCVPNGVKWKYFDQVKGFFTAEAFDHCSVKAKCTLQLPQDERYDGLQYAVNSTTHTSNEVIANQADCSQKLNLHEYEAFCLLRSGGRLQWQNILREIGPRTLSFPTPQTNTLISQAVWEVGVIARRRLEFHEDLRREEFGKKLVQVLETLLDKVQSNWKESLTLLTIITLASRLLASAPQQPCADARSLLRRARNVTFEWVGQLITQLQNCNEKFAHDLQTRLLEMAAICRATYDVDEDQIPDLLLSEEDVTILLHCAIILHDNCPPVRDELPPHLRRLLDRDRRLSHLLEARLWTCLRNERSGLDDAIRAVWATYRPGTDWVQLADPNSRWIQSNTGALNGQQSQVVHFNMLSAQMLVSGKPLGRLPRSFVEHELYLRIFGKRRVLDVIPADMPGMEFATRTPISEHQIFFAMRDNENLTIRAKKLDQEDVLELVPHHVFKGDLPTLLINENVHWLNLATRRVEFRPFESIWKASTLWYIDLTTRTMQTNLGCQLVDIHSPTFNMLSQRISPIERPEFMTITSAGTIPTLEVSLPRLKLSFKVTENFHLECKTLPGMIVDDDQSAGTLIGLENQLVLTDAVAATFGLPRTRRIIVPVGVVSFLRTANHVTVNINTDSLARVRFYDYVVDGDLGRLVPQTSLHSNLYKILLHAYTNHVLPDPLLQCTATEEALRLLFSAASISFQRLTEEDLQLLLQISLITPYRKFHPPSRQDSEAITWSSLPSLSQHFGFRQGVLRILQYGQTMGIFRSMPEKLEEVFKKVSGNSERLVERAAVRAAYLYSGDVIAPERPEDIEYAGRDYPGEVEMEIHSISSMIYHQRRIAVEHDLNNIFTSVSDTITRTGAFFSLSYRQQWLHHYFPSTWLDIYDLCRARVPLAKKKLQLLFSLCAMAYETPEHRRHIPYFVAAAMSNSFRTINPPPNEVTFDLSYGTQPNTNMIKTELQRQAFRREDTPNAHLVRNASETQEEFTVRRSRAWQQAKASEIDTIIRLLMPQYFSAGIPNVQVRLQYHSIAGIRETIKTLFGHWRRNAQFERFVGDVQTATTQYMANASMDVDPLAYAFTRANRPTATSPTYKRTLQNLLDRPAPRLVGPSKDLSADLVHVRPDTQTINQLQALFSEFQNHSSPLKRHYGNDLKESLAAFTSQPSYPRNIPCDHDALIGYRDLCLERCSSALQEIQTVLEPTTTLERSMAQAGVWPRRSVWTLLGLLALHQRSRVPESWAASLKTYACHLLAYQQAQRLLSLEIANNVEEFVKEIGVDVGEMGAHCADWYLIQLEGNFLARPLQLDVAQEMMTPSSGDNSVLQLNMGEGKSSVIVPLVSSALSDGTKLVRILVLKSLAHQMFATLLERLGSLANRRVFFLPFSRQLRLDTSQVEAIRTMLRICMQGGGVLIAQPEHILSFRLMGIDRLLSSSDKNKDVGEDLISLERWLGASTRDILDESDELLHTRYQLVYTVGQQAPLEGSPERWTTTQQLLTLVRKYVEDWAPLDVDVHPEGNGGFPVIRVLTPEAGIELVLGVAREILDGSLPNIQFRFSTNSRLRDATYRFLTERHVNENEAKLVKSQFVTDSTKWNTLLLLRGLLAEGIVVYALKERRYRVDYGLDPSRTMLAVPYRAKDVPSLRSEFGHADVCLVLTCLSYYLHGLTAEQLIASFRELYKLDNPEVEYETWVSFDYDFPPPNLMQLSGVNLDDSEQFSEHLMPLFRKRQTVIDFHLSHIVIPKSAKEFPEKLSTSGWDLAEKKVYPVTGFSGTNDNKNLLPVSILQDDPLGQRSTNAAVLSKLLQPENDGYHCCPLAFGIDEFLQLVVSRVPEIRVLADVGAQMLELRNQDLAQRWLTLRPDLDGAVYFNDDDEAMVITHDKTVEPLSSSPLKQRLGNCLIYMDDAHTRGTDLKLPRNYKAAVTLGPKVTKDRLVQGCMRLRRLGHGQSVFFVAPPEIDAEIRAAANLTSQQAVAVIDVLRWSLLETTKDIEHHIPHWSHQGLEYMRRKEARDILMDLDGPPDEAVISRLKTAWVQPEARTLNSMYGVGEDPSLTSRKNEIFDIPELKERLDILGVVFLRDSSRDEEQEREVNHEIEKEREIQRPPKVEPAIHEIHPDVGDFIHTGRIRAGSSFSPLLSPLAKAKHGGGLLVWSSSLWASKDFTLTVRQRSSKIHLDDYMRSPNWILSSTREPVLVVLSPFEVNELLPIIRSSKYVHLHVYSPRVTRDMKSVDDLKLYITPSSNTPWSIPSSDLSLQLNIFAGQLYLKDRDAYNDLCKFLGLFLEPDHDGVVQSDGFVLPQHRASILGYDRCKFDVSPVAAIRRLLSHRRKGNTYFPTHMGRILDGRPLNFEDFIMDDLDLDFMLIDEDWYVGLPPD